MKKQFQSKAVPRGTRTIWRYLGALFILFTFAIGNVWAAVYKTYALSDLTYTSATLTYEVTGLSGNDQKLNKGERKVEVPCSSASGTLYLSGTGANADRYASIWGSNGTAVDDSRKIAMTSGYGSGISFTSDDILTDGEKYYIVFSNVSNSDYKINAFKYVLSAACPSGDDTTAPTLSSSNPANSATDVAIEGTIVLTFSEAIASVDGTKFSLSGATIGTVAIDGTDATKVNVPYTGAANSATVTLSVAAGAVEDAAGNALEDALSDISFTTKAAAVPTAPSFTSPASEPAAVEYHVGDVISALEVVAAGYPAPTLQWYSNDSKSTTGATLISGEESASYTPSNAAVSDLYFYCVATNASGTAQSEYFHITVAPIVACYTFTATLPAETVTFAVNDIVPGSTGGSIKVLGNTMKNTAYGLSFESSGSAKVGVTLNSLMKKGTKITATVWSNNTSSARSLKLNTSADATKATWSFTPSTAEGEEKVFTYTVTDGDGLIGTNVFNLQRGSNIYLKSLTVSNCGDELLELSSAIDPVAAEGKATITLSKSLVAAGATATATYSAIDAAYDFDEWVISGATIDDAQANPVTITMGSADAVVTLKLKAASVKYAVHFDSKGGSAVADQLIESGEYASVPTAPTKFKYTFGGWSETDGGSTPADLSSIAITAEKTFYAIWNAKVCPTSGEIYSLVADPAKAPGSNTYCPASGVKGVVDLATYATVSGGLAQAVHTTTSNNPAQIQTSTSAIKLSHADGYARALLECPLQEGDTIKFVKSNKVKIAFDTLRTKVVSIASGTNNYIVPAVYAGEDTIMVYYDGSSVNLTSLKVIRPAKYAVTFNMQGHGEQVEPQNIYGGGKVEEPATTSITGWDFGGWFTDAACTEGKEWAFATATVSQDTTLYAKWTALKSMTLDAGEGTGDPIVSYPTVGDPVAVPACPVTFEKSGYFFAGWTYSPSVTVEGGQFTMPDANLTLTAQWSEANYVAQIGAAKYETLEEALLHATDGEIVLLQDINVEAQVEIADGVSATIDLAGHKIEYTSATTLPSGVILVHNGGSLTINDSSDPNAGSVVAGEKAYAALMLTKAGDDASKVANLTINGGSFTGYYYAISGNGNRPNTNITINGGTFTATAANDNLAIYHPQNGTLTINGGSFEGYLSAIEMRAGSLVINDGSFTATAPTFSCNAAGSGTTTQGAAIAIAQHTTKKDIEVTINGGTFTGVKALNESNPQANDPAPQVTMAVTAGTFTGEVSTVDVDKFVSGGSFSEPVAEANCAAGYVPETKANGQYGVIVPAQSIDFEAIIDALGTGAEGKAELDAQLAAKHYDIVGTLNDDRLDNPDGKPYDKGFKVKKTGLTISFSVEAGKVVEITTGSLSGASIKVDAEDAVAMTASHTHTYYNDNAQAFLITMTAASNKYNIFKSINIRNPYLVTLDATTNGGEAVAPMYGKMSVILPSATKGTDHFIGWYDAAENGTLVGLADAEYTPTADVTLYAHFAAQSNDGRLSDLQVDGTTVDGFDMDVHIYNLTVPYGTAVSALPKITLATAYDSYAQGVSIYPTDGPEWRADVDGGCYVQQANVTAEDGTVVYNQVRTKILPKDMACLVWADVPSANTLTYNASKSLLPEDAVTLAINNVSGTDGPAGVKFQKKGYIKIEMNEGTFQAGDVVALDVTGAAGSTMHVFKVQTPSSEADVIGTGEGTTTPVGVNKVAITEDAAALYLARPNDGTYNGWNPHVDYVAVYRAYPNPLVNTITFNGAAGTVDNDLKTITVEVPASTNLATMPVEATFLSNDPSQTNGAVTGGTWVEGDNEYIVTDKDGDQTVYAVTITKAVPSSDATLSALSYGGTAISLADGVYEYDVELPYGTSDVPALAATAHHAGANVTNIDDAAAFVNRHATSTVTVTAEDGTTTQDYTVNFTVSRYESKLLWDGSTMTALSEITAAATAAGVSVTTTGISVSSFSAKTCEENGKSYTKALDFGGKTQSTRYFGIEIPAGKVAKVSLVYRAKSTSRSIIVATALSSAIDESTITSKDAVDGSNLYVMKADMFGGGTLYINTTDGFHVHEISIQLADGYARSSMLGAGVFGTICVPNNVAVEDIQGVTVYELMGREPQYGKLAFDEIVSGELEAGAPYVFQAHGNHMALLYGEISVDAPVDKGNGMYGTFVDQTLTELNDIYYFAQKALWSCVDLTSLSLPANRAYVKLSEIDYLTDPTPAPGRRRVTMAVNGKNAPTGIDAINASEKPMKIMIDGQIYILRGEKVFDATGRLVK